MAGLPKGTTIDNKYIVTDLLKTGAIAHAVLVQPLNCQPDCQLVLRLSAHAGDTRLRQEAEILRLISYLDEEGIARGSTLEAAAFVDEGLFDGAYYLVTEYISREYTTVVQAWEQGLGERWIVPVGRAFVQFLSRLHKLGLEYYDVKTDHLYWSDDGDPQLRVIDFNLCKRHPVEESDTWQQEDLRKTAILMAQMLQSSQNLPECRYPLPLPSDWLSPLDVRGLKESVSESTRAVLGWLHGGFYSNADTAAGDLRAIERELTEPVGSRWLRETLGHRRDLAQDRIQQARNALQDGRYDLAGQHLRKAWACLPFKRVSADPLDDPLASKVYQHVLWLRYIAQDERIADGFRLWLGGRYDDAIVRVTGSGHKDAPTVMRWLHSRRVIDDRQQANWQQIANLVRDGSYADALRECTQYCQAYPKDANAASWLDYLKEAVKQLDSHWWYEREDRPYPMAMARLFRRLDYSQNDQFLACWQQDRKLLEMRLQMHRAVELTDIAWQQFGMCAFGMAWQTFSKVEDEANRALRLHGIACSRSTEDGAERIHSLVIEDWRKTAGMMAQAEHEARKLVGSRDFVEARQKYEALIHAFRRTLDSYLKQQRPTWSTMLPLREEAEVFPSDDLGQLFELTETSLNAFATREDEMVCKNRLLEQSIQELQTNIQQLRAKGYLSRIFNALRILIGD